jgi:hypothetical protein
VGLTAWASALNLVGGLTMDTPERGNSTTEPLAASALEGGANNIDSLRARIPQGSLLAIWIMALLFLALFACSGRASELLLDFSTRVFSPSNVFFVEPCASPDLLLRGYLNGRGNPPPIAIVLDVLSENWNVIADDCHPEDRDQVNRYHRDVREKYTSLFRKVDARLQSYTAGPTGTDRPLSIEYTVLPPDLRVKDAGAVSLPPEVLTQVGVWASHERTKAEQRKMRAALVDSFLLLTVIGAFGSLIFLMRDYIEEQALCMGTYVFRPLLGVFLAMAIFTLDVLAHAIISTASVLELRHEPLYVLALAAGLLSEPAYEAIKLRAEQAIESYRGNTLSEEDTQHQESGQTGQSR